MKVAVFSTEPYDRKFLNAANASARGDRELVYFDARLEPKTASLAVDFPVVCVFVNDDVGTETLKLLAEGGTRLVALRSTGYNNVDVQAAVDLGIQVVRVTDYSPYAVAEHVVGLIQSLNRKIHRAYNRVRDDNFSLNGLLGFDLHGRTVGIVGTGRIGRIFARIMEGFGCRLLGYDPYPHPEFEALDDARYVEFPELLSNSDIISLHCPLTPENYHLIDSQAIAQFKPGMMLINTSRGQLIDTKAAIAGIKSGQIGYLGIDVYEQEETIFFRDLSDTVIQDDTFQLLQSFSNVLITSHQGFFTQEALTDIARTTIESIAAFQEGAPLDHEIQPPEQAPISA
ncbi:2-hydroxyacid dehydrogenase [Baaleninema simplex]|uniref:2-hydroxyacid dehydrogenase n=1 Tax=Baaleninema simplex TaxID=2862350 RepID=UPI00034D080C|nr:2-hydroxyacid dehydrogenase [Baaleninema simplex]